MTGQISGPPGWAKGYMFRSHRNFKSAGLERETFLLTLSRLQVGGLAGGVNLLLWSAPGPRKGHPFGSLFFLSHLPPSAGLCVVQGSLWNSPFNLPSGCSWIYLLSQTCTYLIHPVSYLLTYSFIHTFYYLLICSFTPIFTLIYSTDLYILVIVGIVEKGGLVQFGIQDCLLWPRALGRPIFLLLYTSALLVALKPSASQTLIFVRITWGSC